MLLMPSDTKHWSKKRLDLTFLSPRDVIQEGEEVYLSYGAHANRTLFVEYGFVNKMSETAIPSDQRNGEIDVQDIVEQLFKARDQWMEDILIEKGYWGDWTLHASPKPAHPSYRLITALRLYHLLPSSTPSALSRDELIGPWQDTLLGQRDLVSEENEAAWRGTLARICEILMRRAEAGISALEVHTHAAGRVPWLAWMLDNIRTLWMEEAVVAAAVAKSIREEEQF